MIKVYSYEGKRYEIEIDPATNLPLLPKNQFWRVVDSGFGNLIIEIRKKVFLFSYRVDSGLIGNFDNGDSGLDSGLICNSADNVATVAAQVIIDGRIRNNRRKVMDNLIGDYPPGVLNV